jgi:hypothetical protein
MSLNSDPFFRVRSRALKQTNKAAARPVSYRRAGAERDALTEREVVRSYSRSVARHALCKACISIGASTRTWCPGIGHDVSWTMSWDAFMFVPPLPLLNNTIDGHYMNELEAECSPNSLGSAGIGFDRAQRMHAYKGATLSPDSQDAPRARTSAKTSERFPRSAIDHDICAGARLSCSYENVPVHILSSGLERAGAVRCGHRRVQNLPRRKQVLSVAQSLAR